MEKKSKKPSEELIARLKAEEYCYLTTTGRVSGKSHEIEIWFGINNNALYLLSGGGNKSDWVKNLMKDSNVIVRITKHSFKGMARIVKDANEETMARNLLADKYKERESDHSLSEWARTAQVVGIDIST
jgi:deazaflavin-dependent oxidoreductase (nitroreductase family)